MLTFLKKNGTRPSECFLSRLPSDPSRAGLLPLLSSPLCLRARYTAVPPGAQQRTHVAGGHPPEQRANRRVRHGRVARSEVRVSGVGPGRAASSLES